MCWWLCWCVDVLMCWCVYVDVLMCWCVDVLMCWCVDVLMCWCVDVLMCWCVDVLMCWCVDVSTRKQNRISFFLAREKKLKFLFLLLTSREFTGKISEKFFLLKKGLFVSSPRWFSVNIDISLSGKEINFWWVGVGWWKWQYLRKKNRRRSIKRIRGTNGWVGSVRSVTKLKNVTSVTWLVNGGFCAERDERIFYLMGAVGSVLTFQFDFAFNMEQSKYLNGPRACVLICVCVCVCVCVLLMERS